MAILQTLEPISATLNGQNSKRHIMYQSTYIVSFTDIYIFYYNSGHIVYEVLGMVLRMPPSKSSPDYNFNIESMHPWY